MQLALWSGRGGVPVVLQIVSQDAQQRVCKLLQGRIVALDLYQVVEQGLGGEVHLHASSRHGGHASLWTPAIPSTHQHRPHHPGCLEKVFTRTLICFGFFARLMVSFPEATPGRFWKVLEGPVSSWPVV